ncbi:DNA helicase RecQ [bacterium]|nr:DNA helicase RecQ [bacterium]
MSERSTERLRHVLREHWGYDDFRPHQLEAMTAVLSQQDSVVVLPTGGGKSLCYQVPAVVLDGLAVVVSPLISLMKDQVDALRESGIAAAAVNSSQPPEERRRVADDIRAGRLKLLYVAPERLCTERMLDFLTDCPVSFFAIDEAHCISAWGHDFRPEYRLLGQLRERFPNVGVHAYTATATEHVRDDIAAQLCHQNPQVIVGSFDRPNLIYRVLRRKSVFTQVCDVLDQHRDEAGIIYCISRREVDALTADLKESGYRAAAYHAGLTDVDRHRHQEAFLKEKVDIVVATVAFGMGIDKPNVRFVIHTSAPKSIENYQQETGRAGRDGLTSECWLFYGPGDFITWQKMQDDLTGVAAERMLQNLREIEQYCQAVTCRHAALVKYFGQPYEQDNCGACDACSNELELVPDALITGQKILSCVVRVQENYGADYVAQVLTGSQDQRIRENGHDKLTTYGLLKEHRKAAVREWIEQLAGQGYLMRLGDYRVLKVTPTGRQLLKGEVIPRLLQAGKAKAKTSIRTASSMTGVDVGLFDHLRKLRRQLAEARGVPPFVVFGDVTLQELARVRPANVTAFREIHGVGDHKCAEYGQTFVDAIGEYCQQPGPICDQSGDIKSTP